MRKDTSAALKEYGISSFLFKKNIEEAEKLVDESEKIILVLTTNFNIVYPDPTKRDAGAGVVIVTDKKIVVYHKPLHEGISFIVPVSEIKEILLTPNVLNGVNTIQVITADRIFNFPLPASGGSFKLTSPKAFANKIHRAFLYALNQKEFAAFSDHDSSEKATDITEQIEKLAGLKDKGIITEEEFQSKKEELLSRI